MSAGPHRTPRHGTGAHVALKALQALEGQASDERWHAVAVKALGARAYSEQWAAIVQTLINTGMVFQRGGAFIVSDDGLEWLGVAAAVVPRAEPLQVPVRYVPPMQPLSAKHLVNLRLMREGAFEYRDIPSLLGVERVPYRSSLNIVGGDAKA